MIYAKSTVTGWQFVYEVPSSSIWPPVGDALLSALPLVFVLFCVISVVCCIVVKLTIRPLEEALLSVELSTLAPESTTKQHQNEFAYLRAATAEMANSKNELNHLIHSVSEDVTRRLFTELLSGTQYEYSTVSQLMEGVHSKFCPNDFYVIGVLSARYAAPQKQAQGKQIRHNLRTLIVEYEQEYKEFRGQLIHLRDNENCLVLSFDSTTSLLAIRQHLSRLNELIADYFQLQHIQYGFTFGHIYHSVLDLLYSYQEALQMQTPSSVSPDAAVDSTPESPSDIPAMPDFQKHIDQIIIYIRSEDIADARTLANRILQDLSSSDQSNVYSVFFNSLIDSLATLEYLNLGSLPNNPFIAMAPENSTSNAIDMAKQASEYLAYIFDRLDERQKRINIPCIVTAREYIREHYTDGNLSLEIVAEAANVTGSYLSRVFKTNLGITFTDYVGKYRVEEARALLENSNKSVKEIAAETGFNSVQQFIRVFKKHVGRSPGEYRDSKRS